MVTMIDDDVLELWTSTVARTPIIRPAIGFCSRVLSENAEPIEKILKKKIYPNCQGKLDIYSKMFTQRESGSQMASKTNDVLIDQ